MDNINQTISYATPQPKSYRIWWILGGIFAAGLSLLCLLTALLWFMVAASAPAPVAIPIGPAPPAPAPMPIAPPAAAPPATAPTLEPPK